MEFFQAALKVFSVDEGDGDPGKPGIPYKDSKGLWTIGKGHLIGANLESLKLSERMIDELFKEDLGKAITLARLILGNDFFNGLSPARQMAFVSLTFTMGKGLLEFKETISLAKAGNWNAAAEHVLASKWGKDVDPKQRKGVGRDDRVAYMLRTGEFHPEYGVV